MEVQQIMRWDQLVGHRRQYEWFRTALAQNRMGSTFLFVGPHGIGKRTFARLLAQSLLCRQTPTDQLQACGACEDCAQVAAGTHPDLLQIFKPKEKSDMPLELLIGSDEKRMREGLCYEISLRPFAGRRKVAIVDDADTLNIEGANALLKTLEEPPADSVLILIGTSLQRQIPTIRSRSQTILFHRLEKSELSKLVVEQQIVSNNQDVTSLVEASEGSIVEAMQLSDPLLIEFRGQLLSGLSKCPIDFMELCKSCGAQADSAGKEARLRRERLKWIFRFAANLYRSITLSLIDDSRIGNSPRHADDQQLAAAADRALRYWSSGLSGALACWQTCLLAIEQVDKNANQASLLHAWSTKIAEYSGC